MASYVKITAVLLLTFLSFGISAYSQPKHKTDAEEEELFGLVHEVRLTRKTLTTSNGDKEFGGWIPHLSVFNRNGYLEKSEDYDDKGELLRKTVCQFNSSGQKTEEVEINTDGRRNWKRTFAYDKNGNQIEMTEFYGDEDKRGSTYRRTFDDKGFEINWVSLDSDGKIVSTAFKSRDSNSESTIYYNAEGKIIDRILETSYKSGKNQNQESVNLDADGNISTRYVITTDEKGDVGDVTETEYDAKGKVLEKRIRNYERDSRGNWIKETESCWLNIDNQLVLRKKQEANRVITYF